MLKLLGIVLLLGSAFMFYVAYAEIPDSAYKDTPWGKGKPGWDTQARVLLAGASAMVFCLGMRMLF